MRVLRLLERQLLLAALPLLDEGDVFGEFYLEGLRLLLAFLRQLGRLAIDRQRVRLVFPLAALRVLVFDLLVARAEPLVEEGVVELERFGCVHRCDRGLEVGILQSGCYTAAA